MLRGVQSRLSEKFNVEVRSYSGANVTDFITLFTTGFVESDWCNVSGLLLLIGTNNVAKTEVDIFAKKYNALLQIIRARLGDIFSVVCTIPPRLRDFENRNEKCKVFNKIIVEAAKKAKAVLHPLHQAFLCGGKPRRAYFRDGLHFSDWGFRVVTNVVKMHYRALTKV